MRRLSDWFEVVNERWLLSDNSVSAAQWSNTRLLAFALLLFGPHIPRLGSVASVPSSLIDSRFRYPAGFLADESSGLLIGIALATVLVAGIALSGREVRTVGIATGVLLIVGNSILYTVEGAIVHHQWTAFVILMMSATLWVKRDLSWSPRLVLGWLFAWGLVTSAASKIWGGWLDPTSSAVLGQVDVQAASQGEFRFFARFMRSVLGESPLWELADIATIAIELGFVVAVLRPSWFRYGIFLLIGFHIAILLTLGISFAGILPAYIPFLAEKMPTTTLSSIAAGVLAAVVTVFAGVAVAFSIPDLSVWLVSWAPLPTYLASGLVLLLGPLFVIRSIQQRWPERRRQLWS